jgi:hypothetical protein
MRASWIKRSAPGCRPACRRPTRAAVRGPPGGQRWRSTAKGAARHRHASADGQAVHLLAVLDQRAGAVLGQVSVDGKTNEVTRFAPLLEHLALVGHVVTRRCAAYSARARRVPGHRQQRPLHLHRHYL